MNMRINYQSIRYVINSLSVGGTEKHLSYVLPELRKQGLAIRVIVLQERKENAVVRALEEAGVLLSFYPSKSFIGHGVNFIRLWIDFIRDRQSTTHFFLPQAYLLGGLAAQLAFLPAVQVMSRRSTNDYQKRHPLLKHVERRLHGQMDRILTNSQAALNQLHQEERVPQSKLKLIYNGVPVTVVSKSEQVRLRKELQLNRQQLIITIVANLIPYKGHADLLEALSLIQASLPKDWVCLVVGRDEGILAFLQQQAKTLGIDNHIQWLGARNDVPALLSISSVSVLCSHEEGFSNVILESMMQACALVATAVGGNTESIIDGETGLIVPPKAPKLLADAILRLHQDSALRQRLGRAAKKKVEATFALERCVEAYRELYDGPLEKDE